MFLSPRLRLMIRVRRDRLFLFAPRPHNFFLISPQAESRLKTFQLYCREGEARGESRAWAWAPHQPHPFLFPLTFRRQMAAATRRS